MCGHAQNPTHIVFTCKVPSGQQCSQVKPQRACDQGKYKSSYEMKKLLAKAAINCDLDQYSRYLDTRDGTYWLNGTKFCDLLCAFS